MSNYRAADSSHFVQPLHQPPCLPQTKVVNLPTPSVRAMPKQGPPLSPVRSMSPPRRILARKTRPADSPATQHTRSNRRLKRKPPRRCNNVGAYVLRDEVADSETRPLYDTWGLRQNKAYHREILSEHIDRRREAQQTSVNTNNANCA